nr:hypothetical protein [Tanacetum cinerariifolium]
MQTQTSNTLHNAIMEAGGKDRPQMLASDKEVPIFEGSSVTTTETYMENYKNVSQDIRDQLNVEAEAGESFNVQDLETNLNWEFGKFTSRDGESLESYYSRFYKMMNELVRNQCDVTNHQVNVQFLLQLQPEWQRIARTANPLALVAQQQPLYHPQNQPTYFTQNSSTKSQQAITRNRGKAIVNSPPPIYDHEPSIVAKDDEMSKDREIDKIMALISLSFNKIYKPTNNNLRTSSNTSRANQNNSLRNNRGARGARYDNQRLGNVVGARETVETKTGEGCNMSQGKDAINDDDDDDDLTNERELLASLIEKLRCEIDDNKNRNKFLETSNKVLVEKLKGDIEDFKNENKSLESSNNRFKEANNNPSETNALMYTDLKKFQAELDRRNAVEYASKVEIDYAKAKGDLISYKKES